MAVTRCVTQLPAEAPAFLASAGRAMPSATTTIEYALPSFARWRRYSATTASFQGISGMRMTSPPPATPAESASQPAECPMSSTTMTLLCELAVVWRRSIASVAIVNAESKPKDWSVPQTSLSIVLGTPIALTPASESMFAVFIVPLPPMQTTQSSPSAATVAMIRFGFAGPPGPRGSERLLPGGPEDRPPQRQDPGQHLIAELHVLAVDKAVETVHEPDDVHAVHPDRRLADAADRRIEPRAIPAGGHYADPLLGCFASPVTLRRSSFCQPSLLIL